VKLLFILRFLVPSGGDFAIMKLSQYLSKNNDILIITNVKNSFIKSLPATIKTESIYNIQKHVRTNIRCSSFFSKCLNKSCGKKEVIAHNKFSFTAKNIFINILGKIYDTINFFYMQCAIQPQLKKEKYDYIIGCGPKAAITSGRLGERHKIPVVNFVYETPIYLEEMLGEVFTNRNKGFTKRMWLKAKESYKKSDILLSISILSKKYCEEWIGGKVDDYIYPAVDHLELNDKVLEKNQIIYIGRLESYKNVHLLIQAISEIKYPPKLVIIGSGILKGQLIEQCNKSGIDFCFRGNVSEEEKFTAIRESRFMVFPSAMEGFGMPPMEALICEKPCICSDIPVIKEVYQDKVEYFKNKDLNDLKEKIEFLINNPDYCKKRGKEGRAFVKEKFSWEKSAEKIDNILRAHTCGLMQRTVIE
jgi:glycosyltransferase involved in cell wall biosynthesis